MGSEFKVPVNNNDPAERLEDFALPVNGDGCESMKKFLRGTRAKLEEYFFRDSNDHESRGGFFHFEGNGPCVEI